MQKGTMVPCCDLPAPWLAEADGGAGPLCGGVLGAAGDAGPRDSRKKPDDALPLRSMPAIQASCSLRFSGSDRTVYEALMMAMISAARGLSLFLSGWYFWERDRYAARMTSMGASRATFRLS